MVPTVVLHEYYVDLYYLINHLYYYSLLFWETSVRCYITRTHFTSIVVKVMDYPLSFMPLMVLRLEGLENNITML